MSMNSQDNGRGEKNRTLMELIEELDDLVRNAGAVPLSGGNKRVVYYDDIMEILDDMRVALPRDVIEAQKILQDRDVMRLLMLNLRVRPLHQQRRYQLTPGSPG